VSAALIQVALNGSPYIGVFAAANDHLVLMPPVAPPTTVRDLSQALGVPAVVTPLGGSNVLGALTAMNSRGAVVADIATEDELALLRKQGLKVYVLEGKLNAAGNNVLGIGTVGSAAVCTNKGALTHPKVTPAEKAHLEEVLGVGSNIGTVNHGTPYIGAGLVANAKGAGIGALTTGPEMNRLEDALNYI
jgi:translation initiation factor 6